MSTARLLTRNLIAGATLTASSGLPLLAASQLKTYDLGAVWRTLAGVVSANVIANLGSIQVCDAVALLASNGIASTTFRVRLSTVDATGVAGDAFDSGVLATFNPSYRHFIYYATPGAAGRYLRIDIVESSASYIEAGCLMAGPLWDPSGAFEHGFITGYQDLDVITRSRGGAEYVNAGASMRRFQARFPALTAAERSAQLGYIETVVKRRQPILFTFDKTQADLGQYSIVGRLQEMPTFTNVAPAFYQWPVSIMELV
jgi:hypothetical protein